MGTSSNNTIGEFVRQWSYFSNGFINGPEMVPRTLLRGTCISKACWSPDIQCGFRLTSTNAGMLLIVFDPWGRHAEVFGSTVEGCRRTEVYRMIATWTYSSKHYTTTNTRLASTHSPPVPAFCLWYMHIFGVPKAPWSCFNEARSAWEVVQMGPLRTNTPQLTFW